MTLLEHDHDLTPAEENRRKTQLLPEYVRNSTLHWWSPGQPIPLGDRVLLIGAAVWSGYDMNTLDHVNAAVRDGKTAGIDVFVFDADAMQTQEQLDAVFPGLGFAHHTPYVGFWHAGRLVETACGYEGRLVIARTLGIDDKPLHDHGLSLTTS